MWCPKVAAVLKGMVLRAALLAAVYGAASYLEGDRARMIEGGAFLAQIASLNDLRALQEQCNRTARQQAGRTACDLPTV
jgi:hypothetical protein